MSCRLFLLKVDLIGVQPGFYLFLLPFVLRQLHDHVPGGHAAHVARVGKDDADRRLTRQHQIGDDRAGRRCAVKDEADALAGEFLRRAAGSIMTDNLQQ